jgi:hypothetical protein
LEHLSQVKARRMSQVILYRQNWMATLKDRHICQICNQLAINALEFKDDYGTCNSVSWFCDRPFPSKGVMKENEVRT